MSATEVSSQTKSGPHEIQPEQAERHAEVRRQLLEQGVFPLRDRHCLNDDDSLFRYLIAKQWKEDVAMKGLDEYAKWRQELDVENVFDVNFPSDLFQQDCGYCGVDRLGHPVYYDRPDPTLLARLAKEQPRDVLVQFHVAVAEAGRRLQRAHGTDRITAVVDCRNLGMALVANRAAMGIIKEFAHIDQDRYPENMYVMLIINPPRSFKFVWNAVSVFLEDRVKKKIKFMSDVSKVDAHIDMQHMPEEFGGKLAGALRGIRADLEAARSECYAVCPKRLDHRARILRIYARYAPDRVKQVDAHLEKYKGEEQELVRAMVRKYGPEPPLEPGELEAAAAAATEAAAEAETAAAEAKKAGPIARAPKGKSKPGSKKATPAPAASAEHVKSAAKKHVQEEEKEENNMKGATQVGEHVEEEKEMPVTQENEDASQQETKAEGPQQTAEGATATQEALQEAAREVSGDTKSNSGTSSNSPKLEAAAVATDEEPEAAVVVAQQHENKPGEERSAESVDETSKATIVKEVETPTTLQAQEEDEGRNDEKEDSFSPMGQSSTPPAFSPSPTQRPQPHAAAHDEETIVVDGNVVDVDVNEGAPLQQIGEEQISKVEEAPEEETIQLQPAPTTTTANPDQSKTPSSLFVNDNEHEQNNSSTAPSQPEELAQEEEEEGGEEEEDEFAELLRDAKNNPPVAPAATTFQQQQQHQHYAIPSSPMMSVVGGVVGGVGGPVLVQQQQYHSAMVVASPSPIGRQHYIIPTRYSPSPVRHHTRVSSPSPQHQLLLRSREAYDEYRTSIPATCAGFGSATTWRQARHTFQRPLPVMCWACQRQRDGKSFEWLSVLLSVGVGFDSMRFHLVGQMEPFLALSLPTELGLAIAPDASMPLAVLEELSGDSEAFHRAYVQPTDGGRLPGPDLLCSTPLDSLLLVHTARGALVLHMDDPAQRKEWCVWLWSCFPPSQLQWCLTNHAVRLEVAEALGSLSVCLGNCALVAST